MRPRFAPRTLRGRLLLLFIVLALAPLVVLGGLDGLRARRAMEALIAVQTDTIADRAARLVSERMAVIRSDSGLLAGNTETQRLLIAARSGTGDSGVLRSVLAATRPFLDTLWEQMQPSYSELRLLDAGGRTLVSYPQAAEDDGPPHTPRLSFDVADADSGSQIGTLLLYPNPDWLLPPDMHAGFGLSGVTMLLDLNTHELVGGRRAFQADSSMIAALRAVIGNRAAPRSHLRVVYGDSVRLGSYRPIAGTSLGLVVTTERSEFSTPDTRRRAGDLLFLAVLGGGVLAAFLVLSRRATHSLDTLANAARAVGRGDLSPHLPAAEGDEVGILSRTFADMTQRLRNLIREIEMKRQLAAVGEFATQLSHEIRNPLMSLQLELQGLRREVERGEFGDDAGRSLDTCLREVRRLDRVAHGALALGRPRELRCTRRELETLADCAAAALQAELQSRNIIMEKRVECDYTMVDADPEALEGAIINLLRNAAEAQPQGGRILLLIREAEVGLPPLSPHSHQLDPGKCIELIVADDGPGIPAHIGDRVFHPFVSSKEQGTGIGVPLALRVAQDHGGTVTIHPDGVHGYRGAAFCVRLPRAHEPDSD